MEASTTHCLDKTKDYKQLLQNNKPVGTGIKKSERPWLKIKDDRGDTARSSVFWMDLLASYWDLKTEVAAVGILLGDELCGGSWVSGDRWCARCFGCWWHKLCSLTFLVAVGGGSLTNPSMKERRVFVSWLQRIQPTGRGRHRGRREQQEGEPAAHAADRGWSPGGMLSQGPLLGPLPLAGLLPPDHSTTT